MARRGMKKGQAWVDVRKLNQQAWE